jgi:hypothetical protein
MRRGSECVESGEVGRWELRLQLGTVLGACYYIVTETRYIGACIFLVAPASVNAAFQRTTWGGEL